MIALVIGIKICFKDKVCCLKYSTTTPVSNCCLIPNKQFLSYIMARTSYIWWDDDDVCFVLA